MRFFLATLVACAAALAQAIPYDGNKINPNGLKGYCTDILIAKPLRNTTEIIVEGQVLATGKQSLNCPECIAILFEDTDFKGRAWAIYANGMGDSPQTGRCTAVPANVISSIRFLKQNFGGRSVACYMYSNDYCNDDIYKNWISDDAPDLQKLAWDDHMQTISCYWRNDNWKRDILFLDDEKIHKAGNKDPQVLELWQHGDFEGKSMAYWGSDIDKTCLALKDIGGLTSIWMNPVGQTHCLFYISDTCNDLGIMRGYFGRVPREGQITNITPISSNVGHDFENKIQSVKCFSTTVPEWLRKFSNLSSSLGSTQNGNDNGQNREVVTADPSTDVQKSDVVLMLTLYRDTRYHGIQLHFDSDWLSTCVNIPKDISSIQWHWGPQTYCIAFLGKNCNTDLVKEHFFGFRKSIQNLKKEPNGEKHDKWNDQIQSVKCFAGDVPPWLWEDENGMIEPQYKPAF